MYKMKVETDSIVMLHVVVSVPICITLTCSVTRTELQPKAIEICPNNAARRCNYLLSIIQ